LKLTPLDAIIVRYGFYTFELNRSINPQVGSFWIVPLLHSVSDMTTCSGAAVYTFAFLYFSAIHGLLLLLLLLLAAATAVVVVVVTFSLFRIFEYPQYLSN